LGAVDLGRANLTHDLSLLFDHGVHAFGDIRANPRHSLGRERRLAHGEGEGLSVHATKDVLQRLVLELQHVIEGEQLGPDLLGERLVILFDLAQDLLFDGAIGVVQDLGHHR